MGRSAVLKEKRLHSNGYIRKKGYILMVTFSTFWKTECNRVKAYYRKGYRRKLQGYIYINK